MSSSTTVPDRRERRRNVIVAIEAASGEALDNKLQNANDIYLRPLPRYTNNREIISMLCCAEADAAIINKKIASFVQSHINFLLSTKRVEGILAFLLLLGHDDISVRGTAKHRGFYQYKACMNFYRNESSLRSMMVKRFRCGVNLDIGLLASDIQNGLHALHAVKLDSIIGGAISYIDQMALKVQCQHFKYVYKLDNIVYVLSWEHNKDLIKKVLIENFTMQWNSLKELSYALDTASKIDLPSEWKKGSWLRGVQGQDVILWALRKNLLIMGKDPLLYAITAKISIQGKNAIQYAVDNNLFTEERMHLLQQKVDLRELANLIEECIQEEDSREPQCANDLMQYQAMLVGG